MLDRRPHLEQQSFYSVAMKYRFVFNILFFLISVYGCVKSEINGSINEKTATYDLCKYWWRADYIDFDSADISQQFNFNTDGSGSEIWVRSKVGQMTESKEYFFNWYWNSNNYDHVSLCIEYGENSVVFMDQVIIMDNVMTCFMGSEKYIFYGLDRNGY